MIRTAKQLKDKIKNISGGDDKISKAYIRVFFMERFMERVSISEYKNQFILKGGMLVSSLLGINVRATMDIDTSVKSLPLNRNDIENIINTISSIDLDDNITFSITNIETIMDDFEYPGERIHLEAHLDMIKQPIKIDISTDDIITPGAIEYGYKLMFEDRSIQLITYNVETMLAEKTQTIINRGLANTRMRDFYDIFELTNHIAFSWDITADAFIATCKKRGTIFTIEEIANTLNLISNSEELENLWTTFKRKNFFVEDIDYKTLIQVVTDSITRITKG